MEKYISYRFGAGRYIQEPEVLENSGTEIARFGKRAYIIGGPNAMNAVWKRMEPSFDKAQIAYEKEIYAGFPSYKKIEILKKSITDKQCDVLVGIGGGRIMDLTKAAADQLSIPIVLIPTSAATCASFSPLSVIYTDEGKCVGYLHFDYEVNAVLVDEKVMSEQPPRLLAAGIMDAMAKYIEIANGKPKITLETDNISKYSAYRMAEDIYNILEKYGKQAYLDVCEKKNTETVHNVIFCNIAPTGIVSALMRARRQTAIAHKLYESMRTYYFKESINYLHGEIVATGLIGVYGYYKIPQEYYTAFINWEKVHHELEVKKEWMRFSPGVVAGFHWLVQILSNSGDAVIVNTPVYYPFLNAVKNNDRRLICSDLICEDGIYRIDYEDFEKKIIENQVKVFILCSPHNPAGRVWKKEELERLLAICKMHDVYIISDEIHHDLVFEDNKHIPSLSFKEYEDRMVMLTAASKTFNLAGAQNSIVVIPDEKLREKWDKYTLGHRVIGGNAFGYIATQAAYEGGEEWLTGIKAQIYDNYLYLKKELSEKLPEVIVTPLEGTYLCWVDLKAYVSEENIKDMIQKKCRLAVDYGDWFGGERFGTHIRINLATSHENVKIAVDALVDNI